MFNLFRRGENNSRHAELATQYEAREVVGLSDLLTKVQTLRSLVKAHPHAEKIGGEQTIVVLHLAAQNGGSLHGRTVYAGDQHLSINQIDYDPESPAYNEFFKLVAAAARGEKVPEYLSDHILWQLLSKGMTDKEAQDYLRNKRRLWNQWTSEGVSLSVDNGEKSTKLVWNHPSDAAAKHRLEMIKMASKKIRANEMSQSEVAKYLREQTSTALSQDRENAEIYRIDVKKSEAGKWTTTGNTSTLSKGHATVPWFPAPDDIATMEQMIDDTIAMVKAKRSA